MNFTNIYNENYNWVVNLIKSRINEKHLVEEYANDVFLKVHEHLPNFDESKCTTGLMGWIRSMVFNKITDHYRKKKENNKSIQELVDEDGKELYTLSDDFDIEKDYCTREFVGNAHKIIGLLPDTYKKVATMFYIKDMSYEEIVQATSNSIGTIKGQLSRARKLMQAEFGVA